MWRAWARAQCGSDGNDDTPAAKRQKLASSAEEKREEMAALADCTVVTADGMRNSGLHRAMLCQASGVLRRMWSDLSDAEELELDDSQEDFQAFVDFVYADKCHPLDGEKLPQLLRFANKYEATELRWRCTEVLTQKDYYSVENFKETLDLLLECNVAEALKSIVRWVRRHHFHPVVKRHGDGWLQALPQETALEIYADRVTQLEKGMHAIQKSHVSTIAYVRKESSGYAYGSVSGDDVRDWDADGRRQLAEDMLDLGLSRGEVDDIVNIVGVVPVSLPDPTSDEDDE